MKLQMDIDALNKNAIRIREGLIAKIMELPDNPRIERLPGSAKAFSISSRDLGKNWSVAHHDFKHQYELLVVELNRKRFDAIVPFLESIVETGRYRSIGGALYTVHPDVQKYLRNLLNE